MFEGSQVSLGTIKKILHFTHIQQSTVGANIRHDALRVLLKIVLRSKIWNCQMHMKF